MTSASADGSLFHQKSPTMLLRCGGLHNHKKRQPDLSQQSFHNAEPFSVERFSANGFARPTIPVRRVALIALLAVQVGMHPRTLGAFVPLRRFVRPLPIALS